jgi:hypothetical protein
MRVQLRPRDRLSVAGLMFLFTWPSQHPPVTEEQRRQTRLMKKLQKMERRETAALNTRLALEREFGLGAAADAAKKPVSERERKSKEVGKESPRRVVDAGGDEATCATTDVDCCAA